MTKPLKDVFESFSGVMELLQNPQFQDLLENYERAKRVFLVGYEVQDEVSSLKMFEVKGKSLKPEDYLIAFAEFVKFKEKEIKAIGILLNKPKSWNTGALNELKQKLKENNFKEADLQNAHKIVYHKDVVDIISMIKHAVKASEPLLSPEERVNRAIQKVTKGMQLNDEQQKWMDYIKEHLKQNLTIDEEDLNELPIFTDRGGLNKFKKVFGGNHESIINAINTAIAA